MNVIKMKIIKIVKNKDFYFCLFFIILNFFIGHRAFANNSAGGFKYLYLAALIIEAILISLFINFKKKGWSVEKLFLLFAVPIGALFIIAMPCGETPDDATHFFRIYGITEGEFNVPSEGEYANGSLLPKDTLKSFSVNPNKGNYSKIATRLFQEENIEKEYVAYPGSAVYNPLCYFPQTIGVMIGKIFNSILIEAYFGRICNFIVFLIIVYFAIKIIPKHKKLIIFLSLLPITIQEATSLSPDALTIALSFFIISYVLFLINRKNSRLSKKELGVLYVCAILIGFCKIVYLPLLALYLLIPKECFGGKKSKRIHAIIMASVVFVMNAAWLYVSSKHLVEIREGVDSAAQVSFIIDNPLAFISAIATTLTAQVFFYLSSGLGTSLGPFAIQLPDIYLFILLIVIVLILVDDLGRILKKQSHRLLVSAVFFCIVGLISTSLYIQYNQVGSNIIEGIQGRYFLPIIPLIPLMINSTNKHKTITRQLITTQRMMLLGLFVNFCAIIQIIAQNI